MTDVVIETCIKFPGGRTRMKVTDIYTKAWRTTSGRGAPRRAADGRHPGGRRTGGHPGGRRTGGRYVNTTDGHTCLRYWGEGGYGGNPNAQRGGREEVSTIIYAHIFGPLKRGKYIQHVVSMYICAGVRQYNGTTRTVQV
jgi:hypothetical protein